MTDENSERLQGTVEDVVFKNPENGYVVFVLNCNDIPVDVVGELGDIAEGEKLELCGSYISSAKYGRQFRAVSCSRIPLTSPIEIRRYLGSGIIKGLGPSLAKKMVDKFGADVFDVLENDPLRLSELNGISEDRALSLSCEYRRLSGMRELADYLAEYEIGPSVAAQVWKKYDSSSIALIKENPYILYDEELGVDFDCADAIAVSRGIKLDDTNRIISALNYILRENAAAGHSCLPLKKAVSKAAEYLDIDEDIVENGVYESEKAGQVKILTINDKSYLYLCEYYRAETYIVSRIKQMLRSSKKDFEDLSEEIAGVEFTENIRYEALQKEAISGCVKNKIFILTGGPGTGKTTALNGVIRLMKKRGLGISLCAPTGRAAMRMSELTGETARTIHRLLEVDINSRDKLRFKRNEKNPLKTDVVIVDEMSMVDVLLFEALLRAMKPSASLIMVGDSNQLPSVGAGNLLGDLTAVKIIPTLELTEIFRQASESLIVTNAHKIVNGEYPDLDDRKKDFFFMECANDRDMPKLITDLVKTRLPQAYGYSPVDDIQILTPTRMGAAGTKELNMRLQLALNPPAEGKSDILAYGMVFRIGDKVMQIKNNYDIEWNRGAETGRGIFNGDIGFIEETDKFSGNVIINYDGKRAVYSPDNLKELDLAYAVTVHKSQGSEYNAVIMPLGSMSKNLEYRNLLYTGVTRAKEIIILIGTKQRIYAMVDNNRRTLRYSCIKHLLLSETEDTDNESVSD